MRKFYYIIVALVMFMVSFVGLVLATDYLPEPEDSIFPLEDQIELNVIINRSPKTKVDYNEMTIIKELKEKTNIKLNFEEIPGNIWNEKVPLKFATGSYPDLIIGSLPGNLLSQYADYGVIPALEGLIKEHCPNITGIFNENPDYKGYLTHVDGHIYALGKVQPNAIMYVHDRHYINTKWLDKLGLDMPETLEEYYQVLKAFKEQDPNGNGKKDEIPFSFIGTSSNGGWARNIESFPFGAFGVLDQQWNHLMVKNGQVIFTPMTEGYKEGIKYLHKLYDDGLIDEEVFTHHVSQYRAKGKQSPPVFGSFIGFRPRVEIGTENKENYDYLPPLKGPDGEQLWRYRGVNTNPQQYILTNENQYILETLKLLDYMLSSEEIQMQFQWGPEGWEWTDDGKWFAKENVGEQTTEEYRYNNALAHHALQMHSPEWFTEKKLLRGSEAYLMEGAKIYMKYFPEEAYLHIKLSTEQAEEIGKLQTTIFDYVDQMKAKWIFNGGIEEDWDNYINKLKDMGIEKLMEIRQNSYDNYLEMK